MSGRTIPLLVGISTLSGFCGGAALLAQSWCKLSYAGAIYTGQDNQLGPEADR